MFRKSARSAGIVDAARASPAVLPMQVEEREGLRHATSLVERRLSTSAGFTRRASCAPSEAWCVEKSGHLVETIQPLDVSVRGTPLQPCSGPGMPVTGYVRDGIYSMHRGDAGSHHVCLKGLGKETLFGDGADRLVRRKTTGAWRVGLWLVARCDSFDISATRPTTGAGPLRARGAVTGGRVHPSTVRLGPAPAPRWRNCGHG